ncbi:unnamed protein product [Caenorhabditis auriculariae]|uniref:Uncharacterized protein n=1 Tax=Caenorhabditis auriculariae TaxID=2777116 RepID=A0A8S1GSD0_9PELO|nr:unnamed protein product [Caenorhabditis auriculariae]
MAVELNTCQEPRTHTLRVPPLAPPPSPFKSGALKAILERMRKKRTSGDKRRREYRSGGGHVSRLDAFVCPGGPKPPFKWPSHSLAGSP